MVPSSQLKGFDCPNATPGHHRLGVIDGKVAMVQRGSPRGPSNISRTRPRARSAVRRRTAPHPSGDVLGASAEVGSGPARPHAAAVDFCSAPLECRRYQTCRHECPSGRPAIGPSGADPVVLKFSCSLLSRVHASFGNPKQTRVFHTNAFEPERSGFRLVIYLGDQQV